MKISELFIYPVKSLAGIMVDSAKVERRGLEFDRRWMLIDATNKFLTQREFPKMALMRTSVDRDGVRFEFDGREFSVPALPDSVRIETVEIWNSRVAASIYDEQVNRWFSDSLGAEIRLAAMPETTRRAVNPDFAVRGDDHVSFADGYPVLIIGQGSLDDLNSRLENPVPMNRFRPNFVVEGAAAFAEDGWKKIRVGETIFDVVKPCARCVVTTIDQAKGDKTGVEPLKTLASYRTVGGGIMFGQNLIAESEGGVIRVGDEVEVLA
jgi:uncharacterized protein YcbX